MHHSSCSRIVAAAAALALVLAPGLGRAQPVTPTATGTGGGTTATAEKAAGEDESLYACKRLRGGQITVSFKPETELKDLINWVMGFTCKNFIYDSSILTRSKKITIVSPQKMSPQEAYRVFLVSLSTMGLTVVPKGTVLRIVESGNAKSESVPVYRKGIPGNTDDMVRMVVRPQYLSLNEMNNAISAVKSPVGNVVAVNEANALIVTDWASHIRDMATLSREIDRPMPSSGIYTIKVQYADAKELATKLTDILNLGGSGGAPKPPGMAGAAGGGGDQIASAVPAKILADDRTNTLILLANEAGYLRVRALVKRLDIAMETEGASGSIHVYPLEHANAEELATTINNALSGQGSAGGGTSVTRRGGVTTTQRPAPNPNFQQIQGPSGDLGAAFEGQVKVTSDAPTNSLVVVASGRDFLALKEVIEQLDLARRQVFIEAVVMEVQLSNDLDVGTSFHAGAPDVDDNGGVLLGGVQHGNVRSLNVASLASATGLIGALIGQPLTGADQVLGVSIPSYGIAFQALAKNSNANVLSSPHIIASDNQEAEISVGQNIPYLGGINFGGFGLPTGGQQGQSGIPSLGQNINREKLNLDMKIKPHVNASDRVRLDIELEIKDIGDRDPALGPTWNERKIKTTVVVPDQQSIVIGGLMQDKVIYSESKVPFLGDVPILGYLFKFSQKQKRKTNLLVLLTPYVVKDQLDLDAVLQRKMRERAEFVRSFSTLDQMRFLPSTDYKRKRGLLEEINRTVVGVEQEAEILRSYNPSGGMPDGAVEYDQVPREDPDDGETPAAPEAPAPAPAPAPTPNPAPGTGNGAKPAGGR